VVLRVRGEVSTFTDLRLEKICFVEHCHNQKAPLRGPSVTKRLCWGVPDSGTEGDHCPASTSRRLPSKKTVRMGDKAKPLAAYRRWLCCLSTRSIQEQQNQTLNQHDCGHARYREH
jgi:hypothetical protein